MSVLAPAPAAQRPARIVHVVDTLRAGGAERLIVTTVEHLDRQRFEPSVVVLGAPLDLVPDLESLGVPIECVGLRSPHDWRRGVLRLARVLRRLRPDVLHTHLRLANVYGRVAAVLAGVPRVVTSLHALDYTHWPAQTWRARLWRVADLLSARTVNAGFVAVSRAVAQDYQRHFALRDVDVIHNYLDVKLFASLPWRRAECRRRLGFAADDFVIVNVGRLATEKGQRYLVQALATLRQRQLSARVVFVGDGPEATALKALATSCGVRDAVELTGPQHDVSTFLAAADVFAFPSVGEGLGIALMEAMAAGLPVVASRADGIVEVVEDGVDGLLTPPRDPAALAEALWRVARDAPLRRRLGEAAAATATARFGAEVGVLRLEAVYTRLLADGRPRRSAAASVPPPARRTTRPLRIVHLIDTLRPGGAERLIVTTVKHLDEERFEPAVVALREPLDLAPALEKIGVPVTCMAMRSPLDWRAGVVDLARVLRRLRPDILHTHLRLSNVYGRAAALLAGVPCVLTSLHHLDYTHWPARTWRARLWRAVDFVSARTVNAGFVAVSHAVAEDYRRQFGLRDVPVIHNYIDVEVFASLAALRADSRQALGLAVDDFVVVNVARLSEEKGQRYLVDALAMLRRRRSRARVILVGDGPERQALETLAASLGLADVVDVAGSHTDVTPFLAAADVFAFPSLSEGLGIALMEAMAAGLPVVASRTDGIVEVIDDGVDGLLVPPGDAGVLAETLARLADDRALRHRLAEAARVSASVRFSTAVGVPRLEAMYARLGDQTRRGRGEGTS